MELFDELGKLKALLQEVLLSRFDKSFEEIYPPTEPFEKFPVIIEWLFNQLTGERKAAQLAIATKLYNHLKASIILSANNLHVDSALCARNALEALELFILVSISDKWVQYYRKNKEKYLKPAKIHETILLLHQPSTVVQFDKLRNLYEELCEITHMNRKAEIYTIEPDEKNEGIGIIHFGGMNNCRPTGKILLLSPRIFDVFNHFCYRFLLKSNLGNANDELGQKLKAWGNKIYS